jgi:hypothetical protein
MHERARALSSSDCWEDEAFVGGWESAVEGLRWSESNVVLAGKTG